MEDQKLKESKKRAYMALFACILLIGFEYGTLGSLSLYLAPIAERIGAEITQVSVLFSVNQIVAVVAGLIVTALMEKIGPRLIMITGVLGFMMFFGCLYFGNSIIWVYLAGVGLGISQIFVGFSTTQPIITWWHARNVGTKISLLSVAMAAFGVVIAPAMAYGLELLGFGTTLLVNGGVCGVIMLLLVVFMISNKPETYGLKPFGYEEGAQDADVQEEYTAGGLTFKQAVKTAPFWFVAIGATLAMAAANGFLNNQALVYQSVGFDVIQAGLLVSLFSAARTVWTFLYGFLCDKLGSHRMNVAFMGVGLISVLAFIVIGGKVGSVILALLFCMVGGVSGMLAAVTYSELYGAKAIGALVPFSIAVNAVGAAMTPPAATAIYASTGSFWLYMVLCAVLIAIAIVFLALAGSKKSVEQIKAMETAEA